MYTYISGIPNLVLFVNPNDEMIWNILITRRRPLVEQELLTLPEHMSSPRFLVVFVLLDL